ncbi:MAG: hypothetical protein AAB413_04685, partial [Patescibacteria group bacterium]
RSVDNSQPLPFRIDICVAYNVRRGNPLQKYHPADFALDKLKFNTTGVHVEGANHNKMTLIVKYAGFFCDVTGFDVHRDLFIKAVEKETFDAD